MGNVPSSVDGVISIKEQDQITNLNHNPDIAYKLVINCSGFSTIPKWDSLMRLIVVNSNITEIPTLPNLHFLICKNNPRLTLIHTMPSLVELNCSNTPIGLLETMPKLKFLNCNDCKELGLIHNQPRLNILKCNFTHLSEIKHNSITYLSCCFCSILSRIYCRNVKLLKCDNCLNLENVVCHNAKYISCFGCSNLSSLSYRRDLTYLNLSCSSVRKISPFHSIKNLIMEQKNIKIPEQMTYLTLEEKQRSINISKLYGCCYITTKNNKYLTNMNINKNPINVFGYINLTYTLTKLNITDKNINQIKTIQAFFRSKI